MADIFICYSSDNREIALRFGFRSLQTTDLTGWKDKNDHSGLQCTVLPALSNLLSGSPPIK